MIRFVTNLFKNVAENRRKNKCVQKPFERHVDQIVMLHQPLVVEERHRRIFYIPEYKK